MDIATILGMTLALVLIVLAIIVDFNNLTINIGALQFFIDFPSVMIVIGGTTASVLTSRWARCPAPCKQLEGRGISFFRPNRQIVAGNA